MKRRLLRGLLLLWCLLGLLSTASAAREKVIFQAFWWDCENTRYSPADGWYTYLAELCPRLRALGFDGLWIPSPSKGNSGKFSMGYDPFDHYDLGDKDQKGTIATRFGDRDSYLRLIAVAHANGLEIYSDIVLNHCIGGELDPGRPADLPGEKYTLFRYPAFGGLATGRWPKSWLDFHPNPKHQGSVPDEWTAAWFGPDICYRDPCTDPGVHDPVHYMRDQARDWFVWLVGQTDIDGARFDAVKHFPGEVVGDLLASAFPRNSTPFAVGELVGSTAERDAWAAITGNRSATFDFSLRGALADVIEKGGLFDLGTLPGIWRENHAAAVPFINNHDTWRGAFWDSNTNDSLIHDDRSGDWRQIEGSELAPTIDPDNDRADVAYAAMLALDGSSMIYYEDLFVNYGSDRKQANPKTIQVRPYVANLLNCRRRLGFDQGPLRVRYAAADLLIFERENRALILLNDQGTDAQSATIATDFGPNVRLQDYSLSAGPEIVTDANGRVMVTVPPMSYRVYGPRRPRTIERRSPPRRTTQRFEFADDLGDSRPSSPGYGGRLVSDGWRRAGRVFIAGNSRVRVWLQSERSFAGQLRVTGDKRQIITDQAAVSRERGLFTSFTARRTGWYLLEAKSATAGVPPASARLTVEYQAPATLPLTGGGSRSMR